MGEQATDWHPGWRDHFVWAACNWLLNHVATREYRAFIKTCLDRGKLALIAHLVEEDNA